ncbi:hypothetical protein SAY86_006920 [Trapa natans]|uniref:Protein DETOXIFICATION n=1 Tax=Trapa natans TaxID=22666 RepID=A0AAN7LF59_TRANT|nr:hypothetical protein SAY86_006920 [Trapa natans]
MLSSDNSTALLEHSVAGGGDDAAIGSWWWWRFDAAEAKGQVQFSLPMILTNVFYYSIRLVSVMLAGHLGEMELASATLANTWTAVTGFTIMIGLSGALETLCGQAFGAKLYRTLGIHLQASCIISFIFSIFISILWYFTEPVLILLHQDPDISRTAALYTKALMPGIFAYGFLLNILRFLQTQTIMLPLVILSAIPLAIHVGVAYCLVYKTSLGLEGASLAVSFSLWVSVLLMALYLAFSKRCEHSWEGFTRESFQYIAVNLKLALPSAAMQCLENWAFEILVLLAGLMNDAETTTSLIAMWYTHMHPIEYEGGSHSYTLCSTRISNELGAGNTHQAKKAIAVTLKLSVILAITFVFALSFGHNLWASLFSESRTIIDNFASLTPFLAISITLDSIAGVLSGLARGCGWQHLIVYVNMTSFYLIGMPAAILLGFKFELHAKGLWIGLICGIFCQALALLIITLRGRWSKLDLFRDGDDENTSAISA